MYKLSTLKKRPHLLNLVGLGETSIIVEVHHRQELLELLNLTNRVGVAVYKYLGKELLQFAQVIWLHRTQFDGIEHVWPKLPPSNKIDILARWEGSHVLGARDSQASVRAAVAFRTKNKTLLERLACDDQAYVRAAVAANKWTPRYLLEALAQDVDKTVLVQVAGHPKTPPSILDKLAQEPYTHVMLALNERTTPNTLAKIYAQSGHLLAIRKALSKRADTPRPILEILAKDNKAQVRYQAISALELSK